MGCVPEAERVSQLGWALGASGPMRHFQCGRGSEPWLYPVRTLTQGVLNEGFSFMGGRHSRPPRHSLPYLGEELRPETGLPSCEAASFVVRC